MRRWEEPDPELFASRIDVQIIDTPLECLRKVVLGLKGVLDIRMPDDQELIGALEEAGRYTITTPYRPPDLTLSQATRYYGISVEADLAGIVGEALDSRSGDERVETAQKLFQSLVEDDRISGKPHITLAHEDEVKAEQDRAVEEYKATTEEIDVEYAPTPGPQALLFERCKAFARSQNSMFSFRLTHLVWDDRVMALVLDDLLSNDPSASDLELPEQLHRQLHVTVGTIAEDIRPRESMKLVLAVRDRIAGGVDQGELEEVVKDGGMVRWIKLADTRGEGRIRGMW
jgi:tRNA ligase